MNLLKDTASFEAMVRMLIGLRVKEMRKRHDKSLLWAISELVKSPESVERSEAACCLPSRRQWSKPPREMRDGKTHEQIVRRSILRTIHSRTKSNTLEAEEWGRKLLSLFQRISKEAETGKVDFARPEVIAVPKSDGNNFRVIAPCSNLVDRLLSGFLARYLEQLIEPILGPNCYSFRVNGLNHHNAMRCLQLFRDRQAGKRVYVAECDIQGFFDSLTHEVAIKAVQSAALERGIKLDPAAECMLKHLLRSYSFPEYARPLSMEKINERKRTGSIKWLSQKERDEVYGTIPDNAIGIAQGNPVSPVLSNAVLREADRRVEQVLGSEGFYARYCDDIIIAHPQQDVCQAALDAYIAVMKDLRLPVHPPINVKAYDRDFWGLKSRKPYLWADPATHKGACPWVQFVGYQLRFSGELRVRKSTIDNEKRKISEIVAKTTDIINHTCDKDLKLKRSGKSVFWKVAMHVVSSGTGKRTRRPGKRPALEPCWIDAFPLLDMNSYVKDQLRELDRHREIAFRRLRSVLQRRGLWEDESVQHGDQAELYLGAPFSYHDSLNAENKRIPLWSRPKDYNL